MATRHHWDVWRYFSLLYRFRNQLFIVGDLVLFGQKGSNILSVGIIYYQYKVKQSKCIINCPYSSQSLKPVNVVPVLLEINAVLKTKIEVCKNIPANMPLWSSLSTGTFPQDNNERIILNANVMNKSQSALLEIKAYSATNALLPPAS